MFCPSLIYTIPSLASLLSAVPIFICLLNYLGLCCALRLLPLDDSLLYSLSAFFSGIVFLLSAYLGSQQHEPLLILSYVTSLAMIPALLLRGDSQHYGHASLSLMVMFISLLWELRILGFNRRQLLFWRCSVRLLLTNQILAYSKARKSDIAL